MKCKATRFGRAPIAGLLLVLLGCGDGAATATKPEAEQSTAHGLRVAAPPDAFIGDIVGAGNGCGRPGSMIPVVAPDRTSFALVLGTMHLEFPPNPRSQSKLCKVIMHIHAPPGWQYGVATITSRGYANLTAGVRAQLTSSYSFGGTPLSTDAHAALVGPTDPLGELFTFTDYVSASPRAWSPCGSHAPLKIDVQITLDALSGGPGATGMISNDSVDGVFQKIVGWEWRRCGS